MERVLHANDETALNPGPFDLVERDVVVPAVVELGSPAAFPLATPGLADGQECSTAPIGRSEGGDAGLGAGRHFAATGTAMPGIFTFTAPRWLRLVM
jgi:hypothetical protein